MYLAFRFVAVHAVALTCLVAASIGAEPSEIKTFGTTIDRRINMKPSFQLTQDGSMARGLAFSPDGKTLASSSNTAIILWDLETKSLRKRIPIAANIAVLRFAGKGPFVLVAGRQDTNQLLIWDADTGKKLDTLLIPQQQDGMVSPMGIHDLAFFADGSRFIASAGQEPVYWSLSVMHNARDAKLRKRFPIEGNKRRCTNIAISPDGAQAVFAMASSGGPSRLVIWDLKADKEDFAIADSRTNHNCQLAYSLDGKTFAYLSFFERGAGLTVWDVAAKQKRLEGRVFDASVDALAYLDRGKYLLAAGTNHVPDEKRDNAAAMGIWEVETGEMVSGFGISGDFAVSPDGRWLAKGDANGIVIYDVQTLVGVKKEDK